MLGPAGLCFLLIAWDLSWELSWEAPLPSELSVWLAALGIVAWLANCPEIESVWGMNMVRDKQFMFSVCNGCGSLVCDKVKLHKVGNLGFFFQKCPMSWKVGKTNWSGRSSSPLSGF